jgi:putative membrane protein
VNSKGVEQVLFSKSVGPGNFATLHDNFLYGNDPQLLSVLLVMLVGFGFIFVIERFGAGSADAR